MKGINTVLVYALGFLTYAAFMYALANGSIGVGVIAALLLAATWCASEE